MGSIRGLLLNLVPVGPGSHGTPVNTAAPAITAASVIGTANTATPGTWTGNPVLTYQWQRYAGGAWADISGATNTAYTPVDADFGLSLRVAEIPNGVAALAAYSNQTSLTAEAPAQTVSETNLIVNGDMEAESTWVNLGVPTSQARSNEQAHAGTYSWKVVGNTNTGARQTGVATLAADWYEFIAWVYVTAGSARASVSTPTVLPASFSAAAWNGIRALFRDDANGCQVNLGCVADSTTAYFDDLSIRTITPNVQLTAPSANMRLDATYTLPVSPAEGTKTRLQPRISDASLGNYWESEVVYAASQWDIALYSVATFTRTSRISAANVGVTTGARVYMNADSISLYTTANGTDYTQQGLTISNNTYQTSTGVNAIWTSDVTPGTLVYAAAS